MIGLLITYCLYVRGRTVTKGLQEGVSCLPFEVGQDGDLQTGDLPPSLLPERRVRDQSLHARERIGWSFESRLVPCTGVIHSILGKKRERRQLSRYSTDGTKFTTFTRLYKMLIFVCSVFNFWLFLKGSGGTIGEVCKTKWRDVRLLVLFIIVYKCCVLVRETTVIN